MSVRFFGYIISVVFSAFFIFPAYGVHEFSLSLHQSIEDCKQTVDKVISEWDLKENCSHALIFFGGCLSLRDELHHMCKDTWNESCSKVALIEVIALLKKKKAIDVIDISLISFSENKKAIVIFLYTKIVVGSIVFKGMMRNREMYRHHYSMHVGDVFSEEKHAQSLERIVTVLQEQGYKNTKVTSEKKYRHVDNSIELSIRCHRGVHYAIRKTVCEVRGTFQEKVRERLQQDSNTFIAEKVKKKVYSVEMLNTQTALLKQYLIQQGFFKTKVLLEETVNHKNHTIDLFFIIEAENPKHIFFNGNNFFSHEYLLNKIAIFGDIIAFVPASLLVQELQSDYKKRGFFSIAIDTEEESDSSTFIFKEGKRFCIDDLVIKGAVFVPDTFLKKRFCKPLLHAYFDDDLLKKCLEDCIHYYQTQGFFKCAITKRVYVHQETCSVTFHIDEGKRFFINTVFIQEPFQNLLLKGPFKKWKDTRQRVPFIHKKIIEQQQWLLEHMRKQGYLNVKVTFEKKEIENMVDIVWHIDPGEKIIFGSMVIEGHTVVPYYIIKNIMHYEKAEPWNKEKIYSMYEALKRMDVFKHSALISDNTFMQDGKRNLIVRLEDDNRLEGRVRVGFQQMSKNLQFRDGSTYKVGGTLLCRNMLDRADVLRIDADVTHFERVLGCAYHIPCLWDWPLKTTFKGYGNKYIQPIAIGVQKPLYEALEQGFFTTFSGEYKKIDMAVTTGFEWNEIKKISISLAQAINFEPWLIEKRVPYWFIESTSFFDGLDNTLEPRWGMYALCNAKSVMPLKKGTYFFRCVSEAGIFFPLVQYSNAVVGIRLRYGHVFTENFVKMMPTERFYLGGPTTIRGYQQDECPPLGLYKEQNGDTVHEYFVPQGGKTTLCANVEMRIPLIYKCGFVVFHDVGTLTGTTAKTFAHGGSFFSATGFGFRYQTPLGALRFDIGWKWKKQYVQEKGYAWFLTFGQAF